MTVSLPETFDAYVPSNLKALFQLARLIPTYVSFDTLQEAVPLDAEHASSFDYSKELVPHEGFIHSIRCFYFALGILYSGFPSNTPGVPQIATNELIQRLYHTALLHDLGWTDKPEGLNHPAHAMTFELHGGIMAFEHLQAQAPSLDAKQVADIVQSIVLHTIGPDWASGTSSATAMLMSLSAWFDVGGYDIEGPDSRDFMIHRETVREVEAAYPRGQFAAEATEIFGNEFKNKPDCLLSHYPGAPGNFSKVLRVDPIVE
ncbi:hypothetical protein MIND_00556600 [Mycena indigotica]|uniref:HD domain-containing protein n=1 Tax=Mycena indigotica TaxID=2126181 RepID=A0A8H6WCQ4_9AGAR|nr:uncharacterized protein MIND_00556600 [Mycena indigotica]KAF7307614.1 hypothetical protein MIND_00556600 [Mycena indigotica]